MFTSEGSCANIQSVEYHYFVHFYLPVLEYQQINIIIPNS